MPADGPADDHRSKLSAETKVGDLPAGDDVARSLRPRPLATAAPAVRRSFTVPKVTNEVSSFTVDWMRSSSLLATALALVSLAVVGSQTAAPVSTEETAPTLSPDEPADRRRQTSSEFRDPRVPRVASDAETLRELILRSDEQVIGRVTALADGGSERIVTLEVTSCTPQDRCGVPTGSFEVVQSAGGRTATGPRMTNGVGTVLLERGDSAFLMIDRDDERVVVVEGSVSVEVDGVMFHSPSSPPLLPVDPSTFYDLVRHCTSLRSVDLQQADSGDRCSIIHHS